MASEHTEFDISSDLNAPFVSFHISDGTRENREDSMTAIEPLTENPAQSANERPEDSIYAVQPGKTSDYSSQEFPNQPSQNTPSQPHVAQNNVASGDVPALSVFDSLSVPAVLGDPDTTHQTVDDSSVSDRSKDTDVALVSISPYDDYHKVLKLRPYQEEIVKRSLAGENDIILLPTGTGKTYVAIKVIIQHLNNHRHDKPKVIFFVPTAELATQQLEKIKDYLPLAWSEKAMKIIGESNIPAERVKELVKGEEFAVLVVTPQIINNYFQMSSSASITDFTLLVFDEFHHAKKDHPYNELIKRCLLSGSDAAVKIPQLLGLTATIGIGDADTERKAVEYIIGMCAKFGLQQPPSDSKEVYAASQANVDEEYIRVSCAREDSVSRFLQDKIMAVLEKRITLRLTSQKFKEHGKSIGSILFPSDRHNQMYEHFVVSLSTSVTQFHAEVGLKEDVTYCMVALEHLRMYYKALELVNLLHCKHGVKYIESETSMWPIYRSIDEIWSLFIDNKEELERLQVEEDAERENYKITSLRQQLEQLFAKQARSKVIIFVQMRVVAQYMAELLCDLNPIFRAKEFTSTGPSAEVGGMNPQERFDALQGFEGNRYNILVATSVLEEGIDIQACNMVVRYMYVKDMIAKIQSRGRARHKEGVMMALLDDKLLQQEQKNSFKERLMFKSLEVVREMSEEEFKAKLVEQRKLLTPKKVQPPPKSRAKLPNAMISCKTCGVELGHMTDVRRYGQSHFLIIDGTLADKVTPYPDETVMRPMDGMQPYGKLLCNGNRSGGTPCNNRVGTLMKMDMGMYFGMWYIKGVCVNRIPLKKYKEVETRHNVIIQPITVEELQECGPDNQFPAHRITA